MAIGGVWDKKIEVEKSIKITFNVTPANATIVLRDAEQQIIEPIKDKVYSIYSRNILL